MKHLSRLFAVMTAALVLGVGGARLNPTHDSLLLTRTTFAEIRQPFQREPDFSVTSVNYDLRELMARGERIESRR